MNAVNISGNDNASADNAVRFIRGQHSSRIAIVLSVALLFCSITLLSVTAGASNASCYQWNYTWYGYESPIRDDPEEVCNEWWDSITEIPDGYTKDHMTTNVEPIFPHMHCYGYRRNISSGDLSLWWQEQINVRDNPAGCGKFVSAEPEEGSQCGPARNCVGEPINPTNGAVFGWHPDVDRTGVLSFSRSYNSTDDKKSNLGKAWRHTFSRYIKERKSSSQTKLYAISPNNSSLFNDEATACQNGFQQIRNRVSAWADVTAVYVDNACRLFRGSVYVGLLPIYYQSNPTPAPLSQTVVAYDAIRDDGQQIAFSVYNGSVFAPPGISESIRVIGSGFLITGPDDTTEVYDANGRLVSIRSRGGVVQTPIYDSQGRLSSVGDNFGHTITFGYDAQNRLISTTRQ